MWFQPLTDLGISPESSFHIATPVSLSFAIYRVGTGVLLNTAE